MVNPPIPPRSNASSPPHASLDRAYRLSRDMACVLDGELRIVACCPLLAKAARQPAESLDGRSLFELVDARDHLRVRAAAEQLMRGDDDAPIELDVRMLTAADGTAETIEPLRWFNWRLAGPDPDGNLLALARDVTESRQAEDVLCEAVHRNYRILENAIDGFCTVSVPDAEVRRANPAFANIVGRSVASVLGTHLHELIADPLCSMRLETVLREGEDRFQTQFLRPCGTTTSVEIAARYEPDYDGGVIVCFVRDVTERNRDLARIRESEQRLDLAVHGADLGLWDWHIEADRLDVNERFAEAAGLAGEPLVRSATELWRRIHPDDLETVRELLVAHLRGDATLFQSEHRMCAGDAGWRWVQIRGRVVERNAQGRAIRVTGTLLDISERKAMHDEQRRLEVQLLQAQKMESIGQLAGGMAHDFNNLLTIVLGHTDFAAQSLSGAATAVERDVLENITNIRAAADRAADLTRQLLMFSRRQEMRADVLDLDDRIEATTHMLSRVLPESIQLVHEDRAEGNCRVRADSGQLDQVLINLCVNARDAMPHGGTLRICTDIVEPTPEQRRRYPWLENGPHAVLEVRDTGVGMSAELADRVFEPFFTTKSASDGSGLGLAVVHGIVRGHEGAIELDSRLGEGSTFSILLPLAAAERGANDAHVLPQPSMAGAQGEVVLLAEDEPLVRSLVVRTLRAAGYEVLVAVDGQEAVERFESEDGRVDVVILDAIMPRLSGRKAADSIRSIQPEIPILFSTGYSQEALGDGIPDDPRTALLSKPYKPAELLETLREVIDGASRARRETRLHAATI